MKRNLFYLTLFFFIGIAMTSCKKDDPVVEFPEFISATLSDDNQEVVIVFDQAVYATPDMSGNLDATNFTVTVTGGTLTSLTYSAAHTAGTDEVTMSFEFEGKISGDEVVTITPVDIYSESGGKMEITQEVSVTLVDLGIVGEWYSSGDNVAELLVLYFNVDSIYAKFELNNTYVVESYDVGGVMTEYNGTYVQTKSDVDDIWTITINQSAPSAGASEGIFELYVGVPEYEMRYEVVQTEPDLGNIPPTPADGFGSSNAGDLGDINIQKYYRISY
jgi:hypothetical protein